MTSANKNVWRPGDRLWLQSEKHVWVPAKLESIDGNEVIFIQGNPSGEGAEEKTGSNTGGQIKKTTADLPKLESVDESQLQGLDDICSLSAVPEAALLHTVRVRYAQRTIYTRVGRILITMNPFTPLPIYSMSHIDQYKAAVDSTSLPPHIYGIAHDALRGVQTGNPNHVVLISGESGAGKTESAKLILSFVAEAVHSSQGNIQDRVLQTSPVFEAFGNATTTRNSNSSRFGKWLDLHFNNSCEISGCALTQYLLETTRVCSQSEKERGYHIFFQMTRGLQSAAADSSRMPSQAKRQELKLKQPEEYRYLKGGLANAPGIDDVRSFEDTLDGFESVNFDMDKQYEIFRLLSGILLLGNCDFKSEGDASKLVDPSICSSVAELLGIKEEDLQQRMLVKLITVGGDTMTKPLTADQSAKVRDGFARMLYGRLFEWLVVQMNKALKGGDGGESEKALGVLDIAGFESFEVNSLEQLLINLSNEHLQSSFNATIFTAELEEIKKEGVTLEQDIKFSDNNDILELITGKGAILDILDEQCQLGTSTDDKFQSLVVGKFGKHANCSGPKHPKPVFMIRHFAGEVWYSVDGFLEKNADKPPEGSPDLLKSSSLQLLQDFVSESEGAAKSEMRAGGKRKIPTISSNFRTSMKSLMTKISNSDRHYVRCIKPNQEKASFKFESPMAMEQLLFSGILEAVRIRQIGFGARIPFEQFASKYGSIADKPCPAPMPLPKDSVAKKMAMEKLVEALQKKLGDKDLVPGTCVVGKTKMLLKTEALNALDQARGTAIQKQAIIIQRFMRGTLARKKVKRMKAMKGKFSEWLVSMGTGPVSGTCSFSKHFGSVAAVPEALANIEKMLDEAQALGYHGQSVKSILPVRNRLQQEVDMIEQLKSLRDTKDAVELERVLGRAQHLHLEDTDLYAEAKKRLNYLLVELPLELARAAGVEDDGSEGQSMAAPTRAELEKICAGEIQVKQGPADQRKTMTQNLQERRTVTGCAPQAQLAILNQLQAAADACDINELERNLGEAILQGINPAEMEPFKQLHMNFQEPEFLQQKLAEAEREKDEDLKAEQKRNLLEQFEKLKVECKPVDPYQEDKAEFEELDLALFPGLKSAASWRGHRKSMSHVDGIEGRWKKAKIIGNKVKWNDGTVSSLEHLGSNKAKMEWEGEWFTGELKSDGKLHWSDGDVWERPKGKSGTDKKKAMLCHSKEVIQESLTNLKPNEEELAVQNFRNILYYMADKPAQDLVRQASFDYIIGLAMRAGFCNEVFIQVLKQLTDNPSARSQGLGWQLLLLICQSVLPGEELIPYVRKYLSNVAASSDFEAAARAQNCLQALEMRTLPVLRGHLWKKKPQTLTLKSFDKRYFVVGNHQMFWWATMEDSARPESARPRGGPLCKGVIDFIAEEVEISNASGDTIFELKPKRGAWSKRFEHAAGDPKRVFIFDCKNSEYSRDVWTRTIQSHLEYSDRFRSQTMSMMSVSSQGFQPMMRSSTTDLE